MRFIIVLLAFPSLLGGNCVTHKKETGGEGKKIEITQQVKDSVPPCVREMIENGNKESLPGSPLQVDEYLYNTKKVFLTTAPCCDQFNMLYDDSCRVLCAPTGGFTGRGDGKCPDFSKTAKFIKVVWRKT